MNSPVEQLGSVRSPRLSRNQLSSSDLIFVNAYMQNGQNATRAYMQVHPKAKVTTASTESIKLLGKPWIKAEITQRIRAKGGWDRDKAVSACLDIQRRARDKGDLGAELRSVAELNDLGGLKVQKIADVTEELVKLDTEDRHRRVTELVSQALHADS